jgi:threonine/homoserine/homoserine lactone efflux protein
MLELSAKVLALAIASAMSPGLLAVAIYLLAGKNSPKARAFAFMMGGVVVALILAGVAFAAVSEASSGRTPRIPAYIDIALGVLFILFAAKQVLVKEGDAPRLEEASQKPSLLKWFLIGFIANITNFDAVLLNITAVKEIVEAGVGRFYGLLLISMADLFFILPVLLPLAICVVAPERTEKMLSPVGAWMKKYGRYLVAAIFFIFGVYLLLRANPNIV